MERQTFNVSISNGNTEEFLTANLQQKLIFQKYFVTIAMSL